MSVIETSKFGKSDPFGLSIYSKNKLDFNLLDLEDSNTSSASRISMSKKTFIKTIASIVRETDKNEKVTQLSPEKIHHEGPKELKGN